MKTTASLLSTAFLCLLLGATLGTGSLAGEEAASASSPPPLLIQSPPQDPQSHLHNLLQLTERIYSGAQPDDDAAFAELVKLGIRTVVSVDGARPDVEAAKRAGLRYVHIPIGYDGLDQAAGESIVNVIKHADGPFYIHCHHGKHRGPTAAAIACIADGSASNEAAIDILAKAGTSKHYSGLWRDVKAFKMPAKDKPLPPLVPIAKINSMASLMVAIDQANEYLGAYAENDCALLNRHPALRPADQATLLREGFREAVRLRSTSKADDIVNFDDDAYWNQMIAAEKLAATLEDAIRSNDHASATRHFDLMGTLCTKCHDQYRN